MSSPATTTCWSLIQRAADGSSADGAEFGRRYLPLVRAYFHQRWRGWPIEQEVDDATQDVFVECCRTGGPLARARPERGGFRGFLFGVAQNVARRYERRAGDRRERSPAESAFLQSLPAQDRRQSALFDQRWAQRMMQEAAALMERRAEAAGADAVSRCRLLRLRFEESLPIRAIADRWQQPARAVHDAYAKARREFYGCLRETVALHGGASGPALDAECRQLLDLLG